MKRALALLLVLLAALASPASAAYEGFIIPNAASASFPAQARVFSQDLQIITEGERGNGVLYAAGACLVTPQGSPNMTVHVASCTVYRDGSFVSVSAGDPTISAADGTNPRIDLVSVNNVGTLVVTAGTPASSPVPPTIPQVSNVNNIVLAFVYVPAASSVVQGTQITDKRIFVNAPGGGGGAPTDATYWTSSANGTLSAEVNIGALSTGLLLNTAGTPSAYAGTSCTNQFPRSLNASGAATCASVALGADVSGTLGVGSGGTGLTGGTSGGIPYYSGASTLASSSALTANLPVIGGGAGVAPSVGTRTGNTTAFVTSTGSLVTGNCAKWDANGNLVDHGATCGGGGGGAPDNATYWTATANGTLSAEVNLGALTTGLVLNTVSGSTGTPSAYAGTSCTNQFPRSLNASGTATCASVSLTADVSGDLPFSSLAQGSARSVLGVSGASTADVASIAASADGQVLRRAAGSVDFGAVDLADSDAVTGALPVGNGGTGLTGGTSGGIPYYSGASTLASSSALTANLPVIGGGAGVAPSVGTRSGNTTAFVTTTGSLPSGNCAKWDANGNLVDHGSACGGGGGSVDVQTFSSNGTWTKPGSGSLTYVFVCGSGGGGGGGHGAAVSAIRSGGGGGGGGFCRSATFQTSTLGGTETVTVPAGGTGGSGGTAAAGNDGNSGSSSSFGTWISAPGGGGGGGHNAGAVGGGGGGCMAAGSQGTTASGVSGGSCFAAGGAAGANQDGSIGAGSSTVGTTGGAGTASSYGGASGAGSSSNGTAQTAGGGGTSLRSGGGGGAGGGVNATNPGTQQNGTDGGQSGGSVSAATGGGGTGGVAGGAGAGTGAAGNAWWGGSGGGGGASSNSGTGATGGTGGVGGGGGGGGGAGTNTGGTGGNGGAGWVVVITW